MDECCMRSGDTSATLCNPGYFVIKRVRSCLISFAWSSFVTLNREIQMNAIDSDPVDFGDVNQQLNGSSINSLSFNNDCASFQKYISTIFDPTYQEFKEVKCGDCYIFNYQIFERNSPRPESEKDAERLEHDFKELNFDVYKFENLSKSETVTVLEAVSKRDHSQKRYFVCCILTHGDQEKLCMRDKSIDVIDIFNHFTRLSCPSLSGKPKIFIIQACRGLKYETEVSANYADCFSIEGSQDYLDFLIVNSTYYGTVSFKSSDEEHAVYRGSFFIDELCRSLEQFSGELELLQILTIVNYRVSHLFVSRSREKEKNRKKQMPCFTSRLRSEIKFNKTITPFVSPETRYFDQRRKKSRLGLESTENPLFDLKWYQLQNPEGILFLSISNRNIDQRLEMAASTLWSYFADRKYSRKAPQKCRFKRSEIMKFLNQNQNPSETNCLICFIGGFSRNGRILDAEERKISKENIIKTCESLTGKPKIFIYLLYELSGEETVSTDGRHNTNIIPYHADILEICITITEWKQAVGAMKTFCQILEHNSSEDFVNLMAKLNRELVEKHNFFEVPENQANDKYNRSTFVVTSTLTRSLFLP
ncbi:caspase-3 [Nephila pilipes]|uniref:Caspase-3 n=1 Tax=Nephila pilipes TaxID=299642 RepID=A0A8X6QQ10_NEPPI|nr:caspase-3 [Nephila pilipes]